jgi:hypothetical protein
MKPDKMTWDNVSRKKKKASMQISLQGLKKVMKGFTQDSRLRLQILVPT